MTGRNEANIAIIKALGLDPEELESVVLKMDGWGCEVIATHAPKFLDDGTEVAAIIERFKLSQEPSP